MAWTLNKDRNTSENIKDNIVASVSSYNSVSTNHDTVNIAQCMIMCPFIVLTTYKGSFNLILINIYYSIEI